MSGFCIRSFHEYFFIKLYCMQVLTPASIGPGGNPRWAISGMRAWGWEYLPTDRCGWSHGVGARGGAEVSEGVTRHAPRLHICSWKSERGPRQDLWLLTAAQRHRGALVAGCAGG